MGSHTLFHLIYNQSSGSSSLLDQSLSSHQDNTALTENQLLVDGMISQSLQEISKPATMVALVGAGFASRLTRIGVLDSVKNIAPTLVRGGSHVLALVNESAAFAEIERAFHPSKASFGKDWTKAFINLGSIKLLGGAAQGENPLIQHLLADLGMVGGLQVGFEFGLVEKPQGSFAQQMMQAEALNWSIKGTTALLHGLAPD